jgi:hypothetical protein
MEFLCRFCQRRNAIEYQSSHCPTCQVNYALDDTQSKIEVQTYRLVDKLIPAVEMRLYHGTTVIWGSAKWIPDPTDKKYGTRLVQKKWEFSLMAPEIPPEEILTWVQRLLKLVIFL